MSKKKSVSLDCSKVPHHAISTQKDGSNTPNTPEILNTIINISSEHLDNFKKTIQENSFPNTIKYENTKSNELFLEKQAFDLSSSSCNLSFNKDKVDVHPQVKHFHSQIIKEGLKFKVKQKLKEEPGRRKSWVSSEEDFKYGEGLTFEDEERRKKRRERNKIAATKCRNKKKERTTRLIAEGEVLEIQNASLRDEYKKLVAEKRTLNHLLQQHESTCAKRRKLDNKSCESAGKDKCRPWSQAQESQESQPSMNHEGQLMINNEKNPQVNMNNFYQDNFYDCYNSSNDSFRDENLKFESTKDFNYYDGFFCHQYQPAMNLFGQVQSMCLSTYSSDKMCVAL